MREGREVVVESKEDVGREEEDKTRKYVSQETLDNNGSHQLTPHEKSGRSVREPGSDETPLSDFRGGQDSKEEAQTAVLPTLLTNQKSQTSPTNPPTFTR